MNITVVALLLSALPSLFGMNAAPSSGSVTLHGSYIWKGDPRDPGELRAVFTPQEEGRWRVAFHFRFDGRKHVYRGSAQGSLENGRLSGTVKNERGNRTFLFDGTARDGNFSGNHSERRRNGRTEKSGTLRLSPNR